jgi:hypothetical protein
MSTTAATVAASTLLTTDVLAKSISYTASSVFSLGKMLITSNESYIDLSTLEKMEKRIDLLETIRLYDLWIQELMDKQSERIKSSNAIYQAIHSFMKCLDELHQILQRVSDKIMFHKLKWLYSYRSLSFSDEMEQIQLYKSILDNRFIILQQINSSL